MVTSSPRQFICGVGQFLARIQLVHEAGRQCLVGFSEAFHREIRDQGVSVTAVLPGLVPTELAAGANLLKWMETIATVQPEVVAERSSRRSSRRERNPKSPFQLGSA